MSISRCPEYYGPDGDIEIYRRHSMVMRQL